MGSRAERKHSKVVDHMGKERLAERETKDSKLAVKYCRGCYSKRNSQSHRRIHGKVGLEQSKQVTLCPLHPLPTDSAPTQQRGMPYPGIYLRLCPLTTGASRKRNMAQMKQQIKTPEKDLSNK